MKIGVNFRSSIMKNEKNAPYIGGQWEGCPLHWWSVGRMLLTLVDSEKNSFLHWWSVGRMFPSLVVSWKNVLFIGDQWEECPLHWWSVGG